MDKKHLVCIASEFKGNEFLEEAQAAGWNVTLLTREDLKRRRLGVDQSQSHRDCF